MLQLMIDTALFSGIDKEKVKEISAFSEHLRLPEGAQLIGEVDEGQHPDLYLLVDGAVNVGTRFSPLPGAKTLNLNAISSELFGEIAWLLGNKRTASVTCIKNSSFVRIDGDKFFQYCQKDSVVGVELMSRIASVLAQRVAHLTEQLRDKNLYSN